MIIFLKVGAYLLRITYYSPIIYHPEPDVYIDFSLAGHTPSNV